MFVASPHQLPLPLLLAPTPWPLHISGGDFPKFPQPQKPVFLHRLLFPEFVLSLSYENFLFVKHYDGNKFHYINKPALAGFCHLDARMTFVLCFISFLISCFCKRSSRSCIIRLDMGIQSSNQWMV